MFEEILNNRISKGRLSLRRAAEQIGVSHTTLARILNGEPADVDTLVKICNWLGISVASALNSKGIGEDKIASYIAMLIEQKPDLREIFEEAVGDFERGDLSAEDLAEIVSFAAYKLKKSLTK